MRMGRVLRDSSSSWLGGFFAVASGGDPFFCGATGSKDWASTALGYGVQEGAQCGSDCLELVKPL